MKCGTNLEELFRSMNVLLHEVHYMAPVRCKWSGSVGERRRFGYQTELELSSSHSRESARLSKRLIDGA